MVWLGPWAERRWNRKDPQMVVLDEVAGFLTTVLLFSPDPDRVSLLALTVWAFAMTRFFDILKPPPVHLLERLPHGWGILLDDVAASLYAVAALWILYRFCPVLFAF
jgi:phosphatidylglycerophosphatase A